MNQNMHFVAIALSIALWRLTKSPASGLSVLLGNTWFDQSARIYHTRWSPFGQFATSQDHNISLGMAAARLDAVRDNGLDDDGSSLSLTSAAVKFTPKGNFKDFIDGVV